MLWVTRIGSVRGVLHSANTTSPGKQTHCGHTSAQRLSVCVCLCVCVCTQCVRPHRHQPFHTPFYTQHRLTGGPGVMRLLKQHVSRTSRYSCRLGTQLATGGCTVCVCGVGRCAGGVREAAAACVHHTVGVSVQTRPLSTLTMSLLALTACAPYAPCPAITHQTCPQLAHPLLPGALLLVTQHNTLQHTRCNTHQVPCDGGRVL